MIVAIRNWCILVCPIAIGLAVTLPGSTTAFEAIRGPRLASCDLDGDGQAEVVAAGRVGPFTPLTDPASLMRASVEVYTLAGRLLQPLASTGELKVAEDVAAADLDGDGRDEILVVGDGRLAVIGISGTRLQVRHTIPLGMDRPYRIDAADIGGDSRPEIVIASYAVAPDGGVGVAAISLYAWVGNHLDILHERRIRGHIGDLVLVAEDKAASSLLVLELGGGDEGGQAVGYAASRERLVEAWRAPLFHQPMRVRQLATLPGTGLLAAASVDGAVTLFRASIGGLALVRRARLADYSTSLLLAGNPSRPLLVTTSRRAMEGERSFAVRPFAP